MRSRLALTGAATVALAVVTAPPALAGDGGGWTAIDEDGGGIDFGAEDGADGGGGGSPSECTWSRATEGEDGIPVYERGGNQEFDWYIKECPNPDGSVTRQLVAVPKADPPVSPVALRDRAVDRLDLPAPTVAMNPPGDQVVHVESWLWIDDTSWQTHTKSVTAGGVTVTVTAAPSHVIWDLGNGDVVTCAGPGTPYDPDRPSTEQSTDCSYTYRHSSAGRPDDAYQVSATVVWNASWSVTGAAGGGALPALTTTAPVSVRVAEMQALNQ